MSNLPYSAGSSILAELAQAEDPPERMTATLQSEVAARIAARMRKRALQESWACSCNCAVNLPAGLNPPLLFFPGAERGQRLCQPHPAARSSPCSNPNGAPCLSPSSNALFASAGK